MIYQTTCCHVPRVFEEKMGEGKEEGIIKGLKGERKNV
jgi:hypothetical protein